MNITPDSVAGSDVPPHTSPPPSPTPPPPSHQHRSPHNHSPHNRFLISHLLSPSSSCPSCSDVPASTSTSASAPDVPSTSTSTSNDVQCHSWWMNLINSIRGDAPTTESPPDGPDNDVPMSSNESDESCPSTSSGKTQKENNPNTEMRDKAYNICREFLSGSWKKITCKDMVFKPVTGGLSNILYYCSLPSTHTPLNGEPHQVLLRMYGQLHSDHRPGASTNEGDSELTTITDSVIFMLLSERKLGPKLYGIFPGGRLEEYIPARAMMCKELRDPNLSSIIARKLANVHTLDVPINKEPTWLFSTMQNWLSCVRTREETDDQLTPIATQLMAFDFEQEILWLRDYLKEVKSPVVFAHNDLQEGNILLPDFTEVNKKKKTSYSDDSVVLIDFEYCSYNYRAFDVANHFCEWAFDYSNPDHPNFYGDMNNYPSLNQRELFATEYLKQMKRQHHQEPEVTSLEVDTILMEADRFTLGSHLLWTLWSINNAFTSTISFGYWEYGHSRFQAYLDHKEKLLGNNNSP